MEIPRILWQCGPTDIESLPDHVMYYVSSWREMNPGWSFEYQSESDCLDYITKTRGSEAGRHYERIQKPEIRADMWRYCVIADNGGFYADLDALCRRPIESWADMSKDFVVAQQYHPGVGNMWEQWFFGSKERNSMMLEIVEVVLDLIYQSNYPDVSETLFPFGRIVEANSDSPEMQKVIPWTDMGITHIAAHGKFYDGEYWMKTDFVGRM